MTTKREHVLPFNSSGLGMAFAMAIAVTIISSCVVTPYPMANPSEFNPFLALQGDWEEVKLFPQGPLPVVKVTAIGNGFVFSSKDYERLNEAPLYGYFFKMGNSDYLEIPNFDFQDQKYNFIQGVIISADMNKITLYDLDSGALDKLGIEVGSDKFAEVFDKDREKVRKALNDGKFIVYGPEFGPKYLDNEAIMKIIKEGDVTEYRPAIGVVMRQFKRVKSAPQVETPTPIVPVQPDQVNASPGLDRPK